MFAHRYFSIYGVQGIFLDEGSNLCGNVTYYNQLVQYAKATSPTAVMALNWGTGTPLTDAHLLAHMSPWPVAVVVSAGSWLDSIADEATAASTAM